MGEEGSPPPGENEPPQPGERQKRERQPTNFFIKSSRTPAKESSPAKKRRAVPPPKPEREQTNANGADGSAGEEDGRAANDGKRKRKKKKMSYVVPGSDEDSPDSHMIPRRKDDIEALIAIGDACTLCRRCVPHSPSHRLGCKRFANSARTLGIHRRVRLRLGRHSAKNLSPWSIYSDPAIWFSPPMCAPFFPPFPGS